MSCGAAENRTPISAVRERRLPVGRRPHVSVRAAGIEPAWTWFRARWPAIDPHPVVACGVIGGDRTRTSSFTARRALQYTTATVSLPELESNQHHRLQRPAHDLRSGKNADATNEGAQLEVPPSGSRHEAARSRIERINELRRLVASVGVEGIEPPSAVCRTAALPLDETPISTWLDARRGMGIKVLPAPAALRVSLQPGHEPLRARSAHRHVGPVVMARRRVERTTTAETLFHVVLLSWVAGESNPVRPGKSRLCSLQHLQPVRAAGWSRTSSGRLKRPVPRPFGRRRRVHRPGIEPG